MCQIVKGSVPFEPQWLLVGQRAQSEASALFGQIVGLLQAIQKASVLH